MGIKKKPLIIISPGFPGHDEESTCLPAQQAFVWALNNVFPHMNVIILALQYPLIKKEYSWRGNRVISFDGGKHRKFLRLITWMKAYKRLKQIHDSEGLTGILSLWCSESALIGNYYSKRNKVRHYCWVLGQDARRENFLVRWIRPQPGELIAMSDFLTDEFFKNHRIRPARTIPNGINPGQFKNTSHRNRDVDLLGVGSLSALKQYNVFIRVAAEMKSRHPGLKVILCGKGQEEKKIKDEIKRLGLQHTISLTGELPHEEVLMLMQRSKILLHPSSYEGYSSACLEALFAGCQVVSFTSAEKRPVQHWHIVSSKEEMVNKCAYIIENETNYSPIMVHNIHDTAKAIGQLFGYSVITS